jgi:hypothetical protein
MRSRNVTLLVGIGYVFVVIGFVDLIVIILRTSSSSFSLYVSVVIGDVALIAIGAVALAVAAALKELENRIDRARAAHGMKAL